MDLAVDSPVTAVLLARMPQIRGLADGVLMGFAHVMPFGFRRRTGVAG